MHAIKTFKKVCFSTLNATVNTPYVILRAHRYFWIWHEMFAKSFCALQAFALHSSLCTATFFWLCAIAIAFIINIILIWRARRSICVVHHSSWCSYHSIHFAFGIYGMKRLDASTTSVFNRILVPITETFAFFFINFERCLFCSCISILACKHFKKSFF